MKKLIQSNILILIICLLPSCYALQTHQSAKTLGKSNISLQVIGGFTGVPSFEDSNNEEEGGVFGPQLQCGLGLSNRLDLGITAGFNKLGVYSKVQWLGNQDSKFAVANGVSVFTGAKDGLSIFDGESLNGIELPLFISYHPSNYISIYSNPTINYYQVDDDFRFLEEPLYQTGLFKGLSSGIILHLFNNSDPFEPFNISFEVSWLAPLESNRYILCTSLGVAFKFRPKLFAND